MTRISAYDIEAELIERIADENDTTTAEVIEALCEYLEEVKENNGWR